MGYQYFLKTTLIFQMPELFYKTSLLANRHRQPEHHLFAAGVGPEAIAALPAGQPRRLAGCG